LAKQLRKVTTILVVDNYNADQILLSEEQIDAEKKTDDVNMYYLLREKYRKQVISPFARQVH
jgi:hypothetical protein